MESSITAKLATNSSELFKGNQILSLDYWIGTPNPLPLDKLIIFEVLVTLVFAASLVFIAIKFRNRKLTPPENKFLSKLILYTIWFGPIGWFLVFFRNWGVVFLSARFLWILWAFALILVSYFLFRSYKSNLPMSKQAYLSYQLKKRYFPKKKRGK